MSKSNTKMNNIDEFQVDGNHYKTENPDQQHWNAMIALKANYFQGVITKYVDRHRKKNGKIDLEKALHYATKYQANIYPPTHSIRTIKSTIGPYLEKHGSNSLEYAITICVLCNDIGNAISLIQLLKEVCYDE